MIAMPIAQSSINRAETAKMLMALFDHWNISSEDSLELLGMSPTNRATLTRYRKGEPLGGGRDLMERAGHLLTIHGNLRRLFPDSKDRDLVYKWMSQPNRAFDNLTPVQVVKTHGFIGLAMICSYLAKAIGQ